MPPYLHLGSIPPKRHIAHRREGGSRGEGIYYEEVVTTAGFGRAYSICYHLRPPTRVRNVKLLKCEELKKATDSPLRHHHLKTADIPRRGDLYTGRIPILFNQDVVAYRARPEKTYDKFEYYRNGGADDFQIQFQENCAGECDELCADHRAPYDDDPTRAPKRHRESSHANGNIRFSVG